MKKFLPIFLTIAFINAKAQTTNTISSPPWKSNLVTVHAADSFIISPHLQFNGPSHYFLKGMAKALGVGAVTYQVSKVTGLPSKIEGAKAPNAVLPAVGVGMAVGIPDLVKGFRKNKYPSLVYAFYSKNSVLLKGGTVRLKKGSTVTIKGVAPADGFMQVTLLNGSDLKMLAGDVDIKVKPKNETAYKGSMARAMNLTASSFGCLPQVVVCQSPTTTTTTYSDDANNYIVTCTTFWSPNADNTACDEDTECETIVIPKGGGGGDPGGGGGDPGGGGGSGGDPGGGGGGDITNNTTDPCISTPVNAVLNLPSDNTTKQVLNIVFGPNSSLHLVINQVMNTQTGASGETFVANANTNTIETDLSKTKLDGAAKEFVAAAFLHEIYHAYLMAQANLPFDPETDLEKSHEYMMQHYTNDIAITLKAMFPDMSDATATALALGGYGGVQTNNPDLWNATLSNNHVTNDQVTHVNTYYEFALEGTKCK